MLLLLLQLPLLLLLFEFSEELETIEAKMLFEPKSRSCADLKRDGLLLRSIRGGPDSTLYCCFTLQLFGLVPGGSVLGGGGG